MSIAFMILLIKIYFYLKDTSHITITKYANSEVMITCLHLKYVEASSLHFVNKLLLLCSKQR